MAVKTITIDMEAYEILAAEKRGNESFSQVIKRKLKEKSTASNLLRNLPKCALSEDTLSNIDRIIEDRKRSLPDSIILGEGR